MASSFIDVLTVGTVNGSDLRARLLGFALQTIPVGFYPSGMPLEGAPGLLGFPAREADEHPVIFVLVEGGADLNVRQDQQQGPADENPFQCFPHRVTRSRFRWWPCRNLTRTAS